MESRPLHRVTREIRHNVGQIDPMATRTSQLSSVAVGADISKTTLETWQFLLEVKTLPT